MIISAEIFIFSPWRFILYVAGPIVESILQKTQGKKAHKKNNHYYKKHGTNEILSFLGMELPLWT